nr:NADH dehydrogenase subunit 4L [Mytilopsis leucophaeata]
MFFLFILVLPFIIHSSSFFALLIFSESLMAFIFTLSVLKGLLGLNSFLGFLMIIFLSFAVCEAVLGLSLLVSSCRNNSSFSLFSYSVLKY